MQSRQLFLKAACSLALDDPAGLYFPVSILQVPSSSRSFRDAGAAANHSATGVIEGTLKRVMSSHMLDGNPFQCSNSSSSHFPFSRPTPEAFSPPNATRGSSLIVVTVPGQSAVNSHGEDPVSALGDMIQMGDAPACNICRSLMIRSWFHRGQFHTEQVAVLPSAFPLPFPSPFLQVSSQRAQAQTSPAAKLILSHAAADKLRH